MPEIVDSKEREPGEKVIPCEVFSRIVGYYRRVDQWNIGKKEEFRERKEFRIPKEMKDVESRNNGG